MKTALIIFSSLAFSSCLSGSDYYRDRVEPFLKELRSHYKPQVFDGVMEPSVFPDLEEDQKTLAGIDSNHDGVRDDMEIFINRNFKHEVERVNLKNEFKRAPEFFRNFKKMKLDEFVIYESNSSVDSQCIWSGLKRLGLKNSPELLRYRSTEALYNTEERNFAFSYYSKQLAGRAYGDGYGDMRIFESCKKKIDDLMSIKNEGKR
ncbi:MAG: hypothetical protein ACXVLQ_10235 [Bacteriovorax sp.]